MRSCVNRMNMLLADENKTFSEEPIVTTLEYINPSQILTADFNQDNLLDVLLVSTSDRSFSILLGNGDGTFNQLSYTMQNCYQITDVYIVNVNNDNFLDIVTMCQSPRCVEVIFGNMNGSFQEKFITSVDNGYIQVWITVADFNNDNSFDIAIQNFYNRSIDVLLGHGNGSFDINRKKVSFTGPSVAPLNIFAGDFNNDGKVDIAFLFKIISAICVMLANGDGTFTQIIKSKLTTGNPTNAFIYDFNNDGNLDVATVYLNPYTIYLYFGDGKGNFQLDTNTLLSTELYVASSLITVGDYNSDGYQDIFAITNWGIDILLNTGQCTEK